MSARCGCGAAIAFGPWHLSDCDRWRRTGSLPANEYVAASRREQGDFSNREWEAIFNEFAPEAAQSPQVGARFREQVYRLLVEGYGPGGGYYEPHQRPDAAVALLTCGWGKEQPAAGPPAAVASADPELAKLLEHIDESIESTYGESDEDRGRALQSIQLAIRSALSRLAGQAATANASEGAARTQALNEAAGLARRKARALRRELEADPEYDSHVEELTPDESRIATLYQIADEIEALAKAPEQPEADIGF